MGNAYELTAEEKTLLDRHMDFYRSLETGLREPATAGQEHFVKVVRGLAVAETIHELAYVKHMSLRARQRTIDLQNEAFETEAEPTAEWFSREDWYKLRARQRKDMWRD